MTFALIGLLLTAIALHDWQACEAGEETMVPGEYVNCTTDAKGGGADASYGDPIPAPMPGASARIVRNERTIEHSEGEDHDTER